MFLAIADACHAVLTHEDFVQNVYPMVRQMLPHEAFICGLATVSPASAAHTINLGFPDDYMNFQFGDDGAVLSPLVRSWLAMKVPAPVFFCRARDLDALRSESDKAWLDALHQYGIRTLAAHGMRDLGGSATSYFCLSGLKQERAVVAKTLKLIVPHLHIALMQAQPYPAQPEGAGCPLSARETDVLQLICRGKTNPEIATFLGISAWTVKVHVRNLMSKLKVSTRGHAVAKALKHGFLG